MVPGSGEQMTTEELRKKAKELGIRGYHKMHDETLIAKIEEASLVADIVEKIPETLPTAMPNIKRTAGWLYHKEHFPKVFKAGDIVPDGWSEDNRSSWTFTGNGEWINVNG